MTNTLVVCGGTGAHVALALLRLHTLGQPLGFFRHPDGEPLAFPTLYLVDQDSGDGDREETAWQVVRRLVAAHPGRRDWRRAIGRVEPPELKLVTPLPLGAEQKWFEPPYDTLRQRFGDSPLLDLLTSQPQRDIRFSHGMMGSPAVGSLLFRLKQFDRKQADTNRDGAYHELRDEHERVAVIGSAVGGTGAAVAPTLAQQLADQVNTHVMAVMVLNWFHFDAEPDGQPLDEETLQKAQRRDISMAQNANSAFAYCGLNLARRVATVPVGMPWEAITDRRYTSDTQQPIQESFIHAVAALCGLRHFLDPEPVGPGLYQLGAEDPKRLGGGNRLPGAGDETVQRLADRAATLADTLGVFATALAAPQRRGPFNVRPAIHAAVADVAAPERVAGELRLLVEEYREHLDWMRDVLGVLAQPDRSFTREIGARARLAGERLPEAGRNGLPPETDAALRLFDWTAAWIRDRGRVEAGAAAAVSAAGGYWPPLVGQDSLNVSAEHAGRLTRVPDQNIQGTVEGFIQEEQVTQNGWPDPLAAADHFRYALAHRHEIARRQLEMLLAGLVMDKLVLREVKNQTQPAAISLERLVADEARARGLEDFATLAVVITRREREVVLGFNSPSTLLCPAPMSEDGDDEREGAWGALWQALTGSQRPEEWRTEEAADWRYARRAIQQIRTWIESEKRAHAGTPPPWTAAFEDESGAPVPFGRGRTLSAVWDVDAPRLVRLALPTAEAGDYWPDEETPRIAEEALLAQAPDLRTLETEAGVRFDMVEFELPDRERRVRGLWQEHLEELQQRGAIAAFGAQPDGRRIAFLTADRRAAAVLDNAVVLSRDGLMVRDCTPMRQKPVPGSSVRDGRIHYPDYPLRSDYLGLVETDDGRRVLDLLKLGKEVRPAPPAVEEGPARPTATAAAGQQAASMAGSVASAAGRMVGRLWGGQSVEGEPAPIDHAGPDRPAKATWELRLAGRSDVLPFTLPVLPGEAPDAEDGGHHRAHWMVWPRFRSTEAPYWRAYYVYEHCTDARLRLSTLWLDPDDDAVRRCAAPARDGAHPIQFASGDRRAHTGGPPLAFRLENPQSGQELGLYVIHLDALPRRDADVKLGLDFGTSHTVAAVHADGEKHLVALRPELTGDLRDALTLHVSEDWEHVAAALEDDGLKARGIWQPTYTDESVAQDFEGLLPAELLTIERLANLSAGVGEWQPGRNCVIPHMNMQRRDLADHLVSDFKWTASVRGFRGSEDLLREIYLGMAVELVLAEVVWRRLRAMPHRVDFTFTYPLRSAPAQVETYRRTLGRVMESGTRSLGSALGLTHDIGIFNESKAAKGGTHSFGEVCLVGDLGGGTLDLFLSANGMPGVEFEEVADSAKLGGNELLRTMAEHADRFLPAGAGWATQPADIQTQLRAWMRSLGAARLFGDGAGQAERHAGLNVRGFSRAQDAKAARSLTGRYFRLVVEYMARSLVAYLVRHWYPQVLTHHPDGHDALRVLVQLRGNGWRLWHDESDYAEIEKRVAADVGARAAELWRDPGLWRERGGNRNAGNDLEMWRKHLWTAADDGGGPSVEAPTCAPEGSRSPNPKAEPIRQVVGEAERHEDIAWHSYALAQLRVLHHPAGAGDGEVRTRIHWFDPLPVWTGGGDVKVEFHAIEPPISLSHPQSARGGRRELDDLETELKRRINRDLEESGIPGEVDWRAPIAPLVWEAAFESRRFVQDE